VQKPDRVGDCSPVKHDQEGRRHRSHLPRPNRRNGNSPTTQEGQRSLQLPDQTPRILSHAYEHFRISKFKPESWDLPHIKVFNFLLSCYKTQFCIRIIS
jgi:hypothetical protein